jgi:type II secretory pathway component PulC
MVNRSSIIVSFILATLLAAGGVELFCRTLGQALVGEKPESSATRAKTAVKTPGAPPAMQVNKAPKTQKKENYSIITKRALFGTIEQKEVKKTATPAPALKATSLDLILLGTISGAANVQRAIIQDKKKKTQEIYYKGDAIGSAIIKEVSRGKVILTVNGKDEILLMKELKSSQVPDKVRPPNRRKKINKSPQAGNKTANPTKTLRKITFPNDDPQETDQ